MIRRHVLVVLLAAASLPVLAESAAAQPADAKRLFGEGQQLVAAGKHEEAIQRYEAARKSCLEAKDAASPVGDASSGKMRASWPASRGEVDNFVERLWAHMASLGVMGPDDARFASRELV